MVISCSTCQKGEEEHNLAEICNLRSLANIFSWSQFTCFFPANPKSQNFRIDKKLFIITLQGGSVDKFLVYNEWHFLKMSNDCQ